MAIDINMIAVLFFIIAVFYSIAGFGGGSSYIALLILFGVPFKIAPTLALTCNLIVVAMGTIYFFKNKKINWPLALPFISTSVFFSYLGGLINIPLFTFKLILGSCLFLAGIRMIFFRKDIHYTDFRQTPSWPMATSIGAILGLVSGIVGIGGGIFLAPILYLLKWGNPKYIASTASLFIFVNSCAGLLGHYHKNEGLINYENYFPLLIAVIMGGQLGSFITNYKLSLRKVELSTSFLVLIVSFRLLWSIVFL